MHSREHRINDLNSSIMLELEDIRFLFKLFLHSSEIQTDSSWVHKSCSTTTMSISIRMHTGLEHSFPIFSHQRVQNSCCGQDQRGNTEENTFNKGDFSKDRDNERASIASDEFGDDVATDGVQDAIEEVVDDKDDDELEIEAKEGGSKIADFVVFGEILFGEPGKDDGSEHDDSVVKSRESESWGRFHSTEPKNVSSNSISGLEFV